MMQIELTDVDRRIWGEELDGFVPREVFDVHCHIYRWALNTDPEKGTGGPLFSRFPESGWADLDACDRVLMPGRRMHRLAFPMPFPVATDFEASNRFVAEQVPHDRHSAGLMLVHPSMTAEYLERQIDTHRLVGFKPYRFHSTTGDPVDCRITDFLPEHQIEVADRRGLIVMMHLAKRDGIADRENIDDLLRLVGAYPRVKWILAHCARSYSAWAIEKAAPLLRGLFGVWYDTSSVCESDAIEALCRGVGVDRVMYGSDDIPVGVARGKYIAFGYAWAFLSEDNHKLDLSHCNPAMTFTRYEQLRAMRRAANRLGLTGEQIQDVFHNTARRLVQSVSGSEPGTAGGGG
jgi:glutamate-1-semialdehyde 2,1-aminomutase